MCASSRCIALFKQSLLLLTGRVAVVKYQEKLSVQAFTLGSSSACGYALAMQFTTTIREFQTGSLPLQNGEYLSCKAFPLLYFELPAFVVGHLVLQLSQLRLAVVQLPHCLQHLAGKLLLVFSRCFVRIEYLLIAEYVKHQSQQFTRTVFA